MKWSIEDALLIRVRLQKELYLMIYNKVFNDRECKSQLEMITLDHDVSPSLFLIQSSCTDS